MRVHLLPCCAILVGVVTNHGLAEESKPEPAPPATTRSAPSLQLDVKESGPQVPWRLEIRNVGQEPVLLEADPRLLWFEVRVPGKKRLETCRLPDEVFPAHPERHVRVRMEPGEAVGRRFDPRLYCFAPGGQRQLVPGAQVTPHFGWPEKMKTTWRNGKRVDVAVDEPPYVARPAPAGRDGPDPDEGNDAADESDSDEHVKVIEGRTFALGSVYAGWARSQLPAPGKASGPFELRLASGSDAHAENSATVRLTLNNKSKRPRHVYFRRELVTFEVMGPGGLVQCDAQPDLRAPERHAFSRVSAGASLEITSRLTELCPRGTFARPGLYLVHARFDTSHDGEEYDLDAFVGRVVSDRSIGVRIRTGEKRPLRLAPIHDTPAASEGK